MTPTAFQRIQTSFFRGGRLAKCKGIVASFPPAFGAAVVFVSMSGTAGHAQALDWDAGGAAANGSIDGGTGNWDAGTQNWTSDAGVTNEVYTGGADVTLAGTAGTVTVVGTQTVHSLTFDTDGYVVTGGDLTYANTGDGITVSSGTATIASDITAASGLDKSGAGELILSGSNNVSGYTTVNAGQLTLGNADAISGTTGIVVQNVSGEAKADLGGHTISATHLIVNGLGDTSLDNGTYSFTGTAQLGLGTINAVLAGTGAFTQQLYTGTLNAQNTFTGPVTVSSGSLVVSATGGINNVTSITNQSTLNVDGGGNNAIGDTAVINNTGTFILTGSDETIGAIYGSGNINLNDNALTTGNADNAEISGVVSGTGDLVKQGAGTLTLSGINTATGTLTNNAGAVVVSGTWAGDVDNNAVFDLTGTSTVNGTFNNNATGSVTNSGGVAAILTGLTDFIADGAIGDAAGSITVNTQNLTYRDNHAETGTVTFTVSDTITEERTAGPTWAGTGFTANFATAAAGVFALGGDFTTTGSFTHNSSADLTVTSGNTMTVDQFTNNGSAGVQSGGTLIAGGVANTGTLDVAAGGVIDASGGAIANSGTLDTDGSLTMATLTNTGTVNAQGTITGAVVNQGSGDFNTTGSLSGITSVTNTGSATLDVNTGTTTIGSLTNTTTSGNGTTIAGFATLNVTGAIENGLANGSAASVITNNWTLNAGSTLTNYAGATLNSNAVTSALMATGITNYGTMNVQGLVGAGAGAPTTIVNSGSGATFNVVGNTYGGGAPSATSPSPTPVGSFTNENGAVLNVSGGEFELSTLTNTSAGTGTSITTAGVQVAASGGIDAASIVNSGLGTLNNAGTMNAASGVTNGATATMISTGTINGNLTNAGAATLSGNLNGTLTNNGAGAISTNGDLSGITTLTQSSSNLITVSAGDRLEADVITVNAGSAGLQIGAGATLAGLGNTLSNSAQINVAANGVVEDAGAVSNLGAGVIIFADGGALNSDTNNAGDEGISNAGIIQVNGGTTAITLGGAGIFANSNLLSLASGASVNVTGAMTNSGTINMQNGTATEAVSITGDYAGGGDLGIDVNFDTDSSDMLSVTGNITGATTTVFVNDIGSSAVTGNDIVIASMTGAGADDAFVLSAPLSFGAQVYDIQQSGSDYILGATGAFVTEVVGLEALSYSLIRQTGGATMQQRLGAVLDTGHDVARVWATTGGGTTRFSPASSGTGYTGRMDGYELRAGVNFDAMSVGAGKLIFGLHGAYSAANTALMSDSGEGAISTEGYSIGASATWIGATGYYADAQLQYTGFDNSISADGAQSSVDGLGYAASIEVGKRMALAGSDWTITPNGQLHYASVDFDDFTSGGGLDTAMQSADSLRVGLGVMAERTTQRQGDAATTIYGLANIYHELDGELLIDVAGSDVVTQLPEWSGEVGVGLSRGFENGMGAAYAQVTLASSLDRSVNDSNLGLAIGAQMSF